MIYRMAGESGVVGLDHCSEEAQAGIQPYLIPHTSFTQAKFSENEIMKYEAGI